MRATTIFHPVLVIGTAPTEAVLAVAYAARAEAPYRPLTIVVNQARVDAIRQAAPPESTVLGYEGARFGPDNISVRALAARMRTAAVHRILIAATGHSLQEYRHVIRAASSFGAFPRDVRFAQVHANGTVRITPMLVRRMREAGLQAESLLRGPLGWALLGLAGAGLGLGLDKGVAPWLCLVAAHVITALSQWASWGEYTGDAGIHLQLARRTGEGEPFCYDPGQYSAGSSSPLWTLLLAGLWRAGLHRRLEKGGKLLAAACAHLALVAIAAAAYMWLGHGPAWGLAPLFLATLPQFHVWTARAMETSLAVLTGALVCGVTLTETSLPVAVPLGIFALAFLVRWEHAALLAPVFLLSVWRHGPLMLLAPLPILAIAALNFLRTGSPVASTAASRRRAAQAARHDAGAPRWPEAVRDLIVSKPGLALAAIAGLTAVAIAPAPGPVAMSASFMLGALFFSVVVPMTYDERYLMPSMPAFLLLAVSGLQAAPPHSMRQAAFIAAGILVLERVVTTVDGLPARRRAAARGHLHEREFRRRVGRAVNELLPPHGILGCIEVDLRWFMPRADIQIVGFDAVLDGTVAPAAQTGHYADLLRRRGVSHVLIEENLHQRAGWRDTDLCLLVGHRHETEIPGAGLLTPVRAWTYRNWGDGTPVRWVLWRLEGDAVARPSASAQVCDAPPNAVTAPPADLAVAA